MAMVTSKRKHLNGTCLQFQKFSSLLSWQETWLHAGRHGTGEVTESIHLDPQSLSQWPWHRLLKGQSLHLETDFLQQGQNYFNKATFPLPS